MSDRKSNAWRQKSYHLTDNEWPSDHGAKWTVTGIVLQSSMRLKANHMKAWRSWMSWESTFFGHFFVKYFQTPCVHICMPPNPKDNSIASHMSDFVLIFSSLYCWLFLVMRVKKTKTIESSWFHGKLNLSEKSKFNQFYESHWWIKICINHIK